MIQVRSIEGVPWPYRRLFIPKFSRSQIWIPALSNRPGCWTKMRESTASYPFGPNTQLRGLGETIHLVL